MNKWPITVTMGELTLGCDGANATGVAIAGTSNTYLSFSDLGLVNCDGPGGVGHDITVDTSCNNGRVTITKTVTGTTGVDTSLNGVLNAGTITSPCINVSTLGGLCHYGVHGSSSATFSERVWPGGAQDIAITGNTLTIGGVSGICPGVSNGTTVDLAIPFSVSSPSGPINLQP